MVTNASLQAQRRRAGYLFVLPMLLVLASVAGWPLLRTIYFSLTDATLSNIEEHKFVAWNNFVTLSTDSDWWNSVWNTIRFTLVSVSLETILGTAIALTLNAKFPGRGALRASVLIPWAIPTVVSAQMWNWMYNDLYGVINHIFISLHFISEPWAWTASPKLAFASLVIVDVWKTTPFMALLVLAALQSVPAEIYEAAKIDGASRRLTFWRLTLPLIRPALMVAVIFRGLDAMRIFDLPYVLTGNNRATASMAVFARQKLIDFQDVGYGSAASTFLFLVILLMTVIYVTAGKVSFGPSGR